MAHAAPGHMQTAASEELFLHFLFVCAQTLQDGRTLVELFFFGKAQLL